MDFIIHFYIIFGTNLLTGGPAQIAVFCLFQCFAEKEYQTESKRNQTFGNMIFGTNMIQRTWSPRTESNEESTRQGAHLPPSGAPSTLVGPTLLHRRTSSSYIYLRTPCRCQNRRISGRGSRTVRLESMVTGDGGHDVYPGSGPLYGGNTLLPT